MKLFEAIARRLPAPRLTPGRILAAFAVALACDAIQIGFGPLGWLAPDELLDVIAFGLITWLLGFHVLLLPTFVVEFIPVIDMLPTWTGCVAAVVALRRGAQGRTPPPVVQAPAQLADAPPQSFHEPGGPPLPTRADQKDSGDAAAPGDRNQVRGPDADSKTDIETPHQPESRAGVSPAPAAPRPNGDAPAAQGRRDACPTVQPNPVQGPDARSKYRGDSP